jgi:hypothetical protein
MNFTRLRNLGAPMASLSGTKTKLAPSLRFAGKWTWLGWATKFCQHRGSRNEAKAPEKPTCIYLTNLKKNRPNP